MSNTPMPPPQSCVILGVGFFDFEKMTLLDVFDMHLMIFYIFRLFYSQQCQRGPVLWESIRVLEPQGPHINISGFQDPGFQEPVRSKAYE